MSRAPSRTDTVAHLHDDPSQVDPVAWNALLDAQAAPTPFMRHEYLLALHASGSAAPETGWVNQLLCLRRGDELLGACALYLKSHSYGEYVFDWAWADAYQRHGLRYYPKLLSAVPFTPVPGSRLLTRDAATRRLLLQALRQICARSGLSSAHLLFMDDADRQAAADEGWMLRQTVQFHWLNRQGTGYADFDDFLAGLQRDKRKKIAQERRRVAEAGVQFTVHAGERIDGELWDFFHRCYTLTYAAHHSTPYLTRDFFVAHAADDGTALGDVRRASRAAGAWPVHCWPSTPSAAMPTGATGAAPNTFPACTSRPATTNRWPGALPTATSRFEGGAQGEHKMARGLLPVVTHSAHWLSHPGFADAVARHLEHEGAGIDAYVDELRERNPFRADAAP